MSLEKKSIQKAFDKLDEELKYDYFLEILNKYLKLKIQYTDSVFKADNQWSTMKKDFINHVLSNTTVESSDIWLEIQEKLSDYYNKESYTYFENDLAKILLDLEEITISHYINIKY